MPGKIHVPPDFLFVSRVPVMSFCSFRGNDQDTLIAESPKLTDSNLTESPALHLISLSRSKYMFVQSLIHVKSEGHSPYSPHGEMITQTRVWFHHRLYSERVIIKHA